MHACVQTKHNMQIPYREPRPEIRIANFQNCSSMKTAIQPVIKRLWCNSSSCLSVCLQYNAPGGGGTHNRWGTMWDSIYFNEGGKKPCRSERAQQTDATSSQGIDNCASGVKCVTVSVSRGPSVIVVCGCMTYIWTRQEV